MIILNRQIILIINIYSGLPAKLKTQLTLLILNSNILNLITRKEQVFSLHLFFLFQLTALSDVLLRMAYDFDCKCLFDAKIV